MPALADFLKTYMQEHGLTLRDMEVRTKVSKTVLHNIINGREHEPRLSTLEGIARVVELPLWRVIEMTGVDIGLPKTPSQDAERLVSLVRRNKPFERLIGGLLAAEPAVLRNVLNYLEHPAGDQVHNLRVNILGDRQREMIERLLELQPTLLPNVPPRQNVYEGANLTNNHGAPIWVALVNGVELAEALGWKRDFAWGYLGSGPAALAQAILTYEYGEAPSHRLQSNFYGDVTSTLPQGRERMGRIWTLESQEIDLWYMLNRLIERANPATKPEPELRLLSERRREADG